MEGQLVGSSDRNITERRAGACPVDGSAGHDAPAANIRSCHGGGLDSAVLLKCSEPAATGGDSR